MSGRQVLLLTLCILALVVILQNTDVVTLRFIAWEWQLSQIILLLFTLLVGILIGVAATISRKGGQKNRPL
jgi:uncharacterized integral membrane protein